MAKATHTIQKKHNKQYIMLILRLTVLETNNIHYVQYFSDFMVLRCFWYFLIRKYTSSNTIYIHYVQTTIGTIQELSQLPTSDDNFPKNSSIHDDSTDMYYSV